MFYHVNIPFQHHNHFQTSQNNSLQPGQNDLQTYPSPRFGLVNFSSPCLIYLSGDSTYQHFFYFESDRCLEGLN